MKASDIGEFALIKRLMDRQDVPDPAIVRGVGDDCAVLDVGEGPYMLIAADMIVENIHFSLKWSSPEQIGSKLVECNVSDIVSMGGRPRYGIVSMALPKDTELGFLDKLYDGVYSACNRHGMFIIGGDTTHGSDIVLNLTIVGDVEKRLLRARDMAKEGDLICVTGRLGGSEGGLRLLLAGTKGDVGPHLDPRSRCAEEGRTIARYANAMIDISDGLGSELMHLCDESHVGAVIYKDKIPLSDPAIAAAGILSESACDYALYGGEDLELLFTVPEDNMEGLREAYEDFSIIGRILSSEEGVAIDENGERKAIGPGYDHFRR